MRGEEHAKRRLSLGKTQGGYDPEPGLARRRLTPARLNGGELRRLQNRSENVDARKRGSWGNQGPRVLWLYSRADGRP